MRALIGNTSKLHVAVSALIVVGICQIYLLFSLARRPAVQLHKASGNIRTHRVHANELLMDPSRHMPEDFHRQALQSPVNHSKNRTDSERDIVDTRRTSCRTLPDALLIGFEKCGTMTLLRFLSIHPQIVTPHLPEGFFANRTKTLQDYERSARCTPPGRLRLVKTFAGPSKVYKHRKDMKLLVVVRDPIVRTISHFVHKRLEDSHAHAHLRSFDEFTDDFLKNPYGPYHGIIRYSLYFETLEPWLQLFPRSQFHIVDGDKFLRNPDYELGKVERFLGVPPFITNDHFAYDKKKKLYCLKETWGCMGGDKGRSHPPVSPSTVQKLKDFFQPYNRKFFKVFGNFSWPGPSLKYTEQSL